MIIREDIQEAILKRMNNPIIIPSSVHELLILDTVETDVDYMSAMIMSVNESSLDPIDILSDHPYVLTNGEFKSL